MQTRVKFCGMTRLQDVQYAIELGVDALGFVFVKQSARNLDLQAAMELIKQVPPFIVKVGLFMNADENDVNEILRNIDLNVLQFHGEENEAFCKQFHRPYLKAVPMNSVNDVLEFCAQFPSATGFLFDSHAEGQMGGSGKKFTWTQIPKEINKPVILAGGLHAGNVAEAISVVQPYAVDVSSGIEASKGVKDTGKMQQFIKEVRNG